VNGGETTGALKGGTNTLRPLGGGGTRNLGGRKGSSEGMLHQRGGGKQKEGKEDRGGRSLHKEGKAVSERNREKMRGVKGRGRTL